MIKVIKFNLPSHSKTEFIGKTLLNPRLSYVLIPAKSMKRLKKTMK